LEDKSKLEEDQDAIHRPRLDEVNLGDKLVVLMRKGRGDSVIGRLADGRVILPSERSTMRINPGDTVVCEIVYITKRYVLMMPERVLGDTTEALILNLKNVAESGYYQHAVLAKAFLFLIEKTMEG